MSTAWKSNHQQAERQAIRLPSTETSPDATLSNDKTKHKPRKDARKGSISGIPIRNDLVLPKSSASTKGENIFTRKLSLPMSRRKRDQSKDKLKAQEEHDHNQNMIPVVTDVDVLDQRKRLYMQSTIQSVGQNNKPNLPWKLSVAATKRVPNINFHQWYLWLFTVAAF